MKKEQPTSTVLRFTFMNNTILNSPTTFIEVTATTAVIGKSRLLDNSTDYEMDCLADKCRPSAALIKYIEIIGILNGLESKNARSKYKVLLPSNYYDTVCLLDQKFDCVANFLAELNAADISNELAALIYSKTRENGFDDQRAFDDGGLELREIFDSLRQIITALEARSSYSCSLPLAGNEILVAVTNDKASYAVLDSASHILGETVYFKVDERFR